MDGKHLILVVSRALADYGDCYAVRDCAIAVTQRNRTCGSLSGVGCRPLLCDRESHSKITVSRESTTGDVWIRCHSDRTLFRYDLLALEPLLIQLPLGRICS